MRHDDGDVRVSRFKVKENSRLMRYILGSVAQDAGVDRVLNWEKTFRGFWTISAFGVAQTETANRRTD